MGFIILLFLPFVVACNGNKSKENKTASPPAETKFDPVADSLELEELKKTFSIRSLDIFQSPPPVPNINNPNDTVNKRFIHNRQRNTWYLLPDTVGNKPFSFYLQHPDVSPIAKNLVTGELIPSDNDSTFELI